MFYRYELHDLHTYIPIILNDVSIYSLNKTFNDRYTYDDLIMLPHLHEPEPGLWAVAAYNGRGVAMATGMGAALAARIADRFSRAFCARAISSFAKRTSRELNRARPPCL